MGECVWSRSVMSASVTTWTVVLQAPLVTGFSRKEYWSGLPCTPSGDLPDPGIEPASLKSPVLVDGFFTISTTWEALRAPQGGLKESKEKPAGSRKKDLTFQAESLAMLLPRASWKIKDAPIELDDPDKEMSWQTGESLDWLLLLPIMKAKRKEIYWKLTVKYQLGLNRFENKILSLLDLSKGKWCYN